MPPLLFPKKCVFCEESMLPDTVLEICQKCAGELPFHKSDYLMESGSGTAGRHCDRVVCALEYTGLVKAAVMRYKFFNRPEYAQVFAALLCGKILRVEPETRFDAVVCVPLAKSRERERGYNQAELIAEAVAKYFKVPFISGALVKNPAAMRQSSLQKNERYTNIRNAFAVHAGKERVLRGVSLLLIDDVATTLSTINTCAGTLKENGAGSVVGGVVASPP